MRVRRGACGCFTASTERREKNGSVSAGRPFPPLFCPVPYSFKIDALKGGELSSICVPRRISPLFSCGKRKHHLTHTRARATENSHVSYVFFLMAELSSFPRIDPFPFPSPLPSTFPRGLVIPFPRIDLRSSPQFHQPSLSSNTQKSSSSTYILGQRANFLNRVAKLEIEFSQVFRLGAAVFDNGIFTNTGFQIRLCSEQCRLFDQR